MGLAYGLRVEPPWDGIGAMSELSVVVFAACIFHSLLFLKELRLGFDLWYALVEAGLTEPASPSPDSRSAIMRWLFPVPREDLAGGPITDLERGDYRRWGFGVFLMLLVMPLLGCLSYFGMTWAAGLFHRQTPGTRFLVQPSVSYWLLPAICLGIGACWIPLDWLHQLLLRDRYRRFERYWIERNGFDGRRLMVCLAVITFAGTAVFFLAGVTSFSRFSNAGIEIQRPFSFRSVFYDYARVRSIEHRATVKAPSGKTVERPHYVIEFDDHTSWSSDEFLRQPMPKVAERIARFVSQRSRRPITEQP